MLPCKTNDKNVISSTTLRTAKGGGFLVDGEHKTFSPSHSNFFVSLQKQKKKYLAAFETFFLPCQGQMTGALSGNDFH